MKPGKLILAVVLFLGCLGTAIQLQEARRWYLSAAPGFDSTSLGLTWLTVYCSLGFVIWVFGTRTWREKFVAYLLIPLPILVWFMLLIDDVALRLKTEWTITDAVSFVALVSGLLALLVAWTLSFPYSAAFAEVSAVNQTRMFVTKILLGGAVTVVAGSRLFSTVLYIRMHPFMRPVEVIKVERPIKQAVIIVAVFYVLNLISVFLAYVQHKSSLRSRISVRNSSVEL